MKKGYSISIPNPCSEQWDNFTSTTTGRFCGSCSTNVIDFTKMSDTQILHYLQNRPAHSCGRFRADQLKMYATQTPLKINPGLTLLKAGLMSLMFVLVSKQASAQNTTPKTKTETVQYPTQTVEENTAATSDHIIKGVVRTQNHEPMPGVTIYLQGSSEGTYADASGQFQFPRKLKAGDVLTFSFIGYETQAYVVQNKASENIEITMAESYVELMGALAIEEPESNQFSLHRLWTKVKAIF